MEWSMGQEVVEYDSSATMSERVKKGKITKIGRLYVTTSNGHEFDTRLSPPMTRPGSVGSRVSLYDQQGWDERLWREQVRVELMKLFEYGSSYLEIPTTTMLKLGEAVGTKPPAHLQTQTCTGERCDEIRDAAGDMPNDIRRKRGHQ